MATTKMTFTIPEALAIRLTRRVPARLRSQYVAAALEAALAERERQLMAACAVANADADVQAIEQDFDALEDGMAEPWAADATATR